MANKPTRLLAADTAGVAEAAAILAAGGLVAFPTETVYGLGADARDRAAVQAIYAAKGRPANNPLIVHVASLSDARTLAVFDARAEALAQAFWPGPLTLVLPIAPDAGLAPEVTAGLSSVAIRVPELPIARDLLVAVGRPLAAPSANPSGAVSPTTATHVMAGLSGRIDAVLDGGPCPVGLESTIVGLTGGTPALLRPGGLPAEAIAACLGTDVTPPSEETAQPSSPGQLASHYAPRARLRLNATDPQPGEVLLGFGPVSGAELNLSASGDLTEAAGRLFAFLRQLDDAGAEAIAVAPVPETGLGRAINDRLRRAAAPRPD